MPNAQDHAYVANEFENAHYPGQQGPTLAEAWLGIYQTLWWYDHGVIHIRESNDLAKPIWRQRAQALEAYIAAAMQIPVGDLPHYVDRMMQLPRWYGMQRNNPVGNGLRILAQETLMRWGNPALTYLEEVGAQNHFPGIVMPGRSANPSIDVAAIRNANNQLRAIVSCKWGFRHDRISDPTNECVQYKAAAFQQGLPGLEYFVLTNEFDIRRLDKVLNQPCVDGLIHVHLDAVSQSVGSTALMEQNIANGRLMDLVDFVALTFTW